MVMEERELNLGLASESVPVPRVHNLLRQPCEEMLDQEGNVSRGKPRLRKKALHALILKQMEFYFSDANLSKDRFLGALIKSDPYVDLNIFLRFNKIRSLTDDINRVAKALKNSTILSLSEDGCKVCRTTPINPRENCEACTIYVQDLPLDTSHDWLVNLFSQYGVVAYVSIPRYKSTRKIKGFAFVEFEKVEGADECLNAFREKNCVLPSHTAPHELLSITTYTEDDPLNETTQTLDDPPTEDGEASLAQKRKAQDNNEALEEPETQMRTKKMRIDESGNEQKTKEEMEEEEEEKEENKEKSEKTSDAVEDQVSRNEEQLVKEQTQKDGEKKKKRKRKRHGRSEQIDVTDFGLRIMAKRDWKLLRNKYLQLQRNKMKQLKQHLRKARWNQWTGNHDRKDRGEVEEMEKESTKEKAVVSTPNYAFAPGVIVKIELDEPCLNAKSFKLELRSDTSVKYIDVHEGSIEAFVRCDSADSAKTFVEKLNEKKNLRILEGTEEKAYWNKISQDREEKLGKKDRVKLRGREKLLKKAEKELGKHIKFDEV